MEIYRSYCIHQLQNISSELVITRSFNKDIRKLLAENCKQIVDIIFSTVNHSNASVDVLAHRFPSSQFDHAKVFCSGLVLQLNARHDVLVCYSGHRM